MSFAQERAESGDGGRREEGGSSAAVSLDIRVFRSSSDQLEYRVRRADMSLQPLVFFPNVCRAV